MSKLKQVKINFTLQNYEVLKDKAAKKGITMAEYIRQKLNVTLDANIRNNAPTYFKKVDPTLLFELNMISKSLNTIANNLKKDIEINSFLLIKIYEKTRELEC